MKPGAFDAWIQSTNRGVTPESREQGAKKAVSNAQDELHKGEADPYEKENKTAIRITDKDSTSKIPPGTAQNQTTDTMYLIYDRGNSKEAKSVFLGKTKIQ